MALKFSKEYFPKYDISDLLINIWSFKDPAHEKCDICKTYEKGALNLQKSDGKSSFWISSTLPI